MTHIHTTPGHAHYKQVHVLKHDADELGMAILGGKEHGLPVMISEVFPDSSVSRSKRIAAGDVILAVNGDSFEDMTHNEAVRYLSSLRGTIRFDLENTIEADIDKVCDMKSRYYDFFEQQQLQEETKAKTAAAAAAAAAAGGDGDGDAAEKTVIHKKKGDDDQPAKRPLQQSLSSSEKSGNISGNSNFDLPQVHSSPSKKIIDN